MDQGISPQRVTTVIIAVWIAGAIALFFVLPGTEAFGDLVIYRLMIIVIAFLIVVGAAAFGMKLFRLLVPDASVWERFVFGAGLGLGVLSILVLVLAHVTTSVLPVLFAACPVSIFLFRKELYPLPSLPEGTLSRFVCILLAVFFLLSLAMCFLPSRDYDVLEYHLGAPAEYLRGGRMHFLPHNVYASFPANMEMLYLLALSVGHLSFPGAAVARVVNLLVVALAAGALYAVGKEFVTKTAGLLAAAALLVHPLTTLVAADAYAEGGLVLYTVLALHAAVACVKRASPRWAAASGIAAGLALGCKYTAALFVAVPAVLIIVVAARNWKGVARAALAACCCTAAFSPWAVRNIVNTGNPVYPLGYRMFGGAGWSAEQDARFAKAHRPPEPTAEEISSGKKDDSLLERMLDFVAGAKSASPFLLAFVPLALILARDRRTWIALGFFLLCYALWHFATHRVERFMLPAIPALCLLAGIGADRAGEGSPLVRFAAAVCLTVSAVFIAATEHIRLDVLSVACGVKSAEGWLDETSADSTYSTEAALAMNGLPEGSRVLLVGEARVYYLEVPTVYAVVFSDGSIEGILAGGPEPALARMRELGITHLYVNWCEIRRLRETYGYTYDGRKRVGYLPHTRLMDLFEMVERLSLERSWGMNLEWSFVTSPHRIWELYALRGEPE